MLSFQAVLFFFVFFFNDTATTEIYTTDTLFPYTTLFRSACGRAVAFAHCACRRSRQPFCRLGAPAGADGVGDGDFYLDDRVDAGVDDPPGRDRLAAPSQGDHAMTPRGKVGRASCRERVCQDV